MPLDPSIILGTQAPQIANPLDMAQKAMSFQQMNMQNQQMQRQFSDQQSLRDAYQNNVTQGPDGTPTVNRQGVLSDLAKSNPMLAVTKAQEFQEQDATNAKAQIEVMKDRHELASDIMGSVLTGPAYTQEQKDASWKVAQARALAAGLPGAAQAPATHPGDDAVKAMQLHTMSTKDQFEQANKDREFDLKSDEIDTKHEENSIKRQQMQGDKIDKYTKDMKNDLDADKGRAGNFGTISAKVQSAQRLQTLVGAYKDGNLPPAQMEEMALGLSNMLAPGGGASRDQVKALVPSSVVGDANKLVSWIKNEPQGAGQQAFVKQMSDTIDREAGIANDQLNSIRVSRLAAHSRLKQIAPDQYNSVLQSYGIDPKTMINSKGRYQAAPKTADHPQDDQAVSWAQANPKDPRASAILKLNSGGQ